MGNEFNTRKETVSFIAIVFLLAGALFGMIIMAFVFGNLGLAADTTFDPINRRINNESGVLNDSYTLSNANVIGFANPIIVLIVNTTNGVVDAANYTVSAAGILSNLTAEGGNVSAGTGDVNITYTYDSTDTPQLVSTAITNFSLGAIETYSEQSNTQFSTAAIAVTLLILLALFILFWRFFMGTSGGGSAGSSSIGGGGRSGGSGSLGSGRNF